MVDIPPFQELDATVRGAGGFGSTGGFNLSATASALADSASATASAAAGVATDLVDKVQTAVGGGSATSAKDGEQ